MKKAFFFLTQKWPTLCFVIGIAGAIMLFAAEPDFFAEYGLEIFLFLLVGLLLPLAVFIPVQIAVIAYWKLIHAFYRVFPRYHLTGYLVFFLILPLSILYCLGVSMNTLVSLPPTVYALWILCVIFPRGSKSSAATRTVALGILVLLMCPMLYLTYLGAPDA